VRICTCTSLAIRRRCKYILFTSLSKFYVRYNNVVHRRSQGDPTVQRPHADTDLQALEEQEAWELDGPVRQHSSLANNTI
jgi:hypothetical protein